MGGAPSAVYLNLAVCLPCIMTLSLKYVGVVIAFFLLLAGLFFKSWVLLASTFSRGHSTGRG